MMRKITKPHTPKQNKYIFTEGMDYSKTGRASIWGKGDKDTVRILSKAKISGKWLNLAAGDGRYNLYLLKKADKVVASDIDESALSKLWHNTPEKYKKKLKIKNLDITKKLPFKSKSFDGVFCAGTLHIFPLKILERIVKEIDRVLTPGGKVIMDFASDIERVRLDNKPYIIKDEPNYTLTESRGVLKRLFRNYKISMYTSEVPEEILKEANPPYRFSCKFIILVADKF